MLIQRLHAGQSLQLWFVLSRHAAHLLVLAFQRLPHLHSQSLEKVLVLRGAAHARTRGPALRVGALEELAHEPEAGLADVGAAGKHVEDGVDGAAEVGKGRDVGTGSFGGFEHRRVVLQETGHLEENGQESLEQRWEN